MVSYEPSEFGCMGRGRGGEGGGRGMDGFMSHRTEFRLVNSGFLMQEEHSCMAAGDNQHCRMCNCNFYCAGV